MSQNALGLIEVVGVTTAIEAADASVKAANVRLIGYEKVTAGLIVVKIEGDVGAVKAAIEAARASASRVGEVRSTLVIPRPARGIDLIVNSRETVGVAAGDESRAELADREVPEEEKQDNAEAEKTPGPSEDVPSNGEVGEETSSEVEKEERDAAEEPEDESKDKQTTWKPAPQHDDDLKKKKNSPKRKQ